MSSSNGQRKRNGSSSSSLSSARRIPSSSPRPRSRGKRNAESASVLSRGFDIGRERGQAAVESIVSAGSRAVESVGAHPIPMTLIGVGLTWLLLESRGIRPTEVRAVERSREAIGEAVGRAASAVGEGASVVGEYVTTAASAVGATAAGGARYTKKLWGEHPIAMSAAVLTAGIAAGMLIPATSGEGSLLGASAGKIVRTARRRGAQLLEKGKELASTGMKAAKGEAERQELTPDVIARKVKRVARRSGKAMSNETKPAV